MHFRCSIVYNSRGHRLQFPNKIVTVVSGRVRCNNQDIIQGSPMTGKRSVETFFKVMVLSGHVEFGQEILEIKRKANKYMN